MKINMFVRLFMFHVYLFVFCRYPGFLTITIREYLPKLNQSKSFSRPLSVLEEEITGDVQYGDIENVPSVADLANMTKNEASNDSTTAPDAKPTMNVIKRNWVRNTFSDDFRCNYKEFFFLYFFQLNQLPSGVFYKYRSSHARQRTQSANAPAGSIITKFSPNGELVVFHCAVTVNHDHELVVLSMDKLRPITVLRGHLGIIYALDWFDNRTVVSVSSDHTAIVWYLNMDDESTYEFKVLPHPSYLYAVKCLQIPNENEMYVVTGGRDGVLRIWHVYEQQQEEPAYRLMQELDNGHQSYITSIVTNKKNSLIYSADANGCVVEWTMRKNRNQKYADCFELKR